MDQNTTPKKSILKKGPFRTEAIIPLAIIIVVIGVYFKLFFDTHIRHLGEWGLSKAIKAEVDIGSLHTSFIGLSLEIGDVALTDRSKPERNMLEIGSIRFKMSWDALLRGKILIEEAAVEGLKYGQPRKSAGFILPEDPPDNSPSLFATEGKKLEDKAVNKLESENQDNVFGDIAAMLKGTTGNEQLGGLSSQIASKKMLADLQTTVDRKKQDWDQRLKTLPQSAYFDDLSKRAAKIKTGGFSSPQEFADNLKEANALIQEIDGRLKDVQKTGSDAQTDLNSLNKSMADIEKQVHQDVSDLENHFKIPHIDAKSFIKSLIMGYIQPYKSEVDRYYKLAYKYVPPNVMHKKSDGEDTKLQVRERAKGKMYEFGRQNSYPLLWVKKIAVSSDLGADPMNGKIAGAIYDITTSQAITGRPTKASVTGDFPSQQISGFKAELSLDNRTEKTLIDFLTEIQNFPVTTKEIYKNPDVGLTLNQAKGHFNIDAHFVDFRDVDFVAGAQFSQPEMKIDASNITLGEILRNVFNGIKDITAVVKGKGSLPGLNIEMDSNLGTALEQGFKKELDARIAEMRKRIETEINMTIGKQKKDIEDQINKLKAQVDGQVKKVQAQIDAQKAKVEKQKKDSENKAKGDIQEQGKKTLDDLKKKFGL